MKLTLKIDRWSNLPILFLHHEKVNPGFVSCYQTIGQHSEADKGYMKLCRKPGTIEEHNACNKLLREWANLPY